MKLSELHPSAGRLMICEADLKEAKEQNKKMYEALKNIISIVNESTGVSGYHLNGGEAEWDEFDEIIELQSLLKEIDASN